MNLKDRRTTENLPSSTPSTAITPKSKPLSPEEIMKKQSSVIKNLQQQKEESTKEIQKLSSENLIIRKKLQEKSATIVSLNEKIGKLSDADLILKENAELKTQNEQLQKEEKASREKAEATILNVKCEYDEKLHALDARDHSVTLREQELKSKEKNLDAEISKEAYRITEEKREKMQRALEDERTRIRVAFDQKINAIYFVTCGSLLYDIFVTIFPLIKKNRFKHDVAAAGSFVWSVIVFFWTHGVSFSSTMWSMCIDIPVNILNTVVAVLVNY